MQKYVPVIPVRLCRLRRHVVLWVFLVAVKCGETLQCLSVPHNNLYPEMMYGRGAVHVLICIAVLLEPLLLARLTRPASVFRVFRINAPGNLPACRSVCSQWRSDAYVATILTAEENAKVAAQLSGYNQVLLGGQRDTTLSPFRWTEGPVGEANSGSGVGFWTGGAANWFGACTAAMYCNFYAHLPNAQSLDETLLTMFGSQTILGTLFVGTWNDEGPNKTSSESIIDGCACRWDPVVFSVFPVSPSNVSLPYCRWCCATWRRGAYVATILSAEDNAMVYALLWSNWTFVALGARRQPDSDNMESKRFRWTEGPLRAADNGLGTLLWTTEASFTGGTCAQDTYCNFRGSFPSNGIVDEVQLVMSGPLASPTATLSSWVDRSPTGIAGTSFVGCACRYDVAMLTESISLTEVSSRSGRSQSASSDMSLSVSSFSFSVSSFGGTRSHSSDLQSATSLSSSDVETSSVFTSVVNTSSASEGDNETSVKRAHSLLLLTPSPSRTSHSFSSTESRMSFSGYTPEPSATLWRHPRRLPSRTLLQSLPATVTPQYTVPDDVVIVDVQPSLQDAIQSPLVVVSGAMFGDLSGGTPVLLLSVLSCSATAAPPSAVTAYLISPLYYMGHAWVAWGNMLLAAALTALHAAVTAVVSMRGGVCFSKAATGVCRFPALSIQCADFLIPGAVYGAVQLVVSPSSSAAAVASGTTVLLASALLLAASVLVTAWRALPLCWWEAYEVCSRSDMWCAVLLPSGRWAPCGLRNALAPLFTSMVHRWWWLASAPRALTLLLSVVAGLQGNHDCGAVLLLLGLLNVAVGVSYLRCHRLPMNRVVVPATHGVVAAVCALKYVTASSSPSGTPESVAISLTFAQSLHGALVVWRTVWTWWVSYKERGLERIVTGSLRSVDEDVSKSTLLSVTDAVEALWYGGGGGDLKTEEGCSKKIGDVERDDNNNPSELFVLLGDPTYGDQEDGAMVKTAHVNEPSKEDDVPSVLDALLYRAAPSDDQIHVVLSETAADALCEEEPSPDEFCGIQRYFVVPDGDKLQDGDENEMRTS